MEDLVRTRVAEPTEAQLDLIETPLAFAALDGTITVANRAFRTWTADAAQLDVALRLALPELATMLNAGKPQVVKATVTNARGRTFPVEYLVRLADPDRVVIEGRDVSRVFEKEAMLQAFARTIEVNNRLLTRQKAEIGELLGDIKVAYASVQRLLDTADQGFVTIDRDARLLASRSAAFDRWFGAPPVGARFAECLGTMSADVATMFELFWNQLATGVLPIDLALEMLPAELRAAGRWFRLVYQPELDAGGALCTLLVAISDVTDEIERQRAEARHSELANLSARFSSDRGGFVQFVTESDALIAAITAPAAGGAELLRAIHTLKGNCGLFGAQVIAARCHELEDQLAELGDGSSEVARRALAEDWRALRRRTSMFLEHSTDGVWVTRDELGALQARIGAMTGAEVQRALETWMWESGDRRLERLGAQVRELGVQLTRGPIDVVVDGGGLRFDPVRWNAFWMSLVHLVANSVDHGIEPSDERVGCGKPARARVELRVRGDGAQLVIEIGDDGRGIDWVAVARAARGRGLDTGSHGALVQSLFADGLSTRAEVDAVSGRGVGLAAVRAATERLAGTIEVESEPGRGTTFRFRFPMIGVATTRDAEPARRSVA